MPECSLIQNLIPCFLTFCSTIEFNPYLLFEFLIFIILVCITTCSYLYAKGSLQWKNDLGLYFSLVLSVINED